MPQEEQLLLAAVAKEVASSFHSPTALFMAAPREHCTRYAPLQKPATLDRMTTALRFPEDVVHSDPERLGGTPVFVGTRVPVQSLFDYLEAGDSLEEFLHQFPSVRREQAISALDYARDQVMAGARPA